MRLEPGLVTFDINMPDISSELRLTLPFATSLLLFVHCSRQTADLAILKMLY